MSLPALAFFLLCLVLPAASRRKFKATYTHGEEVELGLHSSWLQKQPVAEEMDCFDDFFFDRDLVLEPPPLSPNLSRTMASADIDFLQDDNEVRI